MYNVVLLLAVAATGADSPPKLELSAPAEVPYKAGKFLVVEAKGAARVSFEVALSPPSEVDYTVNGTALVLAMPPAGTTVTVFAAAAAGGEVVTAKAVVVVKEPPRSAAQPGSGGNSGGASLPPPPGRVKFVTLLYGPGDLPGFKTLAASQTLRQGCADRGAKFYALDASSADAVALGFDKLYAQAKGPCLVLQDIENNLIGGQVYRPATFSEQSILDAVDEVSRK